MFIQDNDQLDTVLKSLANDQRQYLIDLWNRAKRETQSVATKGAHTFFKDRPPHEQKEISTPSGKIPVKGC